MEKRKGFVGIAWALVLVGAALLLAAGLANAFACHLGSTQFNKAFVAARGQELNARIGFFNLHGDRITHIVVTGVSAPSGWVVSYSPQAQENKYNVSGIVSTVKENFALNVITEAERLPSKGVDTSEIVWFQPEGLSYFIPLSIMNVKIKVPESGVTDWNTYEVAVSSTGSCFDLAAMAEKNLTTLSQARDFSIKVKVVPDNYFEEKIVVTLAPSPLPSLSPSSSVEVKAFTGAVVGKSNNDYWFLGYVVLLGLIAIVLIAVWRRNKIKPIPVSSNPINSFVGSNEGVNVT